MAVNAEESLAGSLFPCCQRWSCRKLLYPENRGWLIILEEEPQLLNAFIFLVTVSNAPFTANCTLYRQWIKLNYSLFQHHYQEDNINLMPWLRNCNKCLDSFVVPQIPVHTIHYVETIGPYTHTSVILMIHNGAKSPLSSTLNDKQYLFMILSNQLPAPDKALIPGRTKNTPKHSTVSHLYHLANWCCTACTLLWQFEFASCCLFIFIWGAHFNAFG